MATSGSFIARDSCEARRENGPPVMEFDQAGSYIQGWGGESGDGYTWPSTEHGITVDYKEMSGSAAMGMTIRS